MPIHQILSDNAASITDLKKNPMGTVAAGTEGSGALAILNRNEPAFYCVTPELFEYFQELEENLALGKIAQERKKDGKIIAVNIDDL